MKIKFKAAINIFILAGLIFSLAILKPLSINAIEYGGVGGKPANPDPNNPRTKSIFVYTLDPGKSVEDGVLVVNNTQEEKTLLVYGTDSEKSSDGSFACKQFTDTKASVGSWIKLDKNEVTLQPNSNEKIDFKLTVPENASVGEENGCIMIQEKEASSVGSESGVSLSFRTGLRVVVTIPGIQIRSLSFKSLETSKKDDGTIKAKVEIENTGNVSIDTHIHVTTSGPFGIIYNYIDNEYPILRAETSTYNFEIPKPFWGGIFTISADAEYDSSPTAAIGEENYQSSKIISIGAQTIISVPEPLALLLEIGFILLIILIIILFVKRYKNEKNIQKTWLRYSIKKEDNITSLASKYCIEWGVLAKVNRLKPPYLLKEGEFILVPPSKK